MKRTIFSFFSLFLVLQTALSQSMSWNQRYQDYFNLYKDIAIEQMQKYHIPASITLAQGVLEQSFWHQV